MAPDYDIRRIEVIDDATASMYRRMTPEQRLRLGFGQFEFAVRTMEAGVRCTHPEWSPRDIRDEVMRRLARAAG